MDEATLCTVVVLIIIAVVIAFLQKTVLSDWGFGEGCTVEIQGLATRCDLNGAWGVIKGFKKGRYAVHIEGSQGILAQRKNLHWKKNGVPTRRDRVVEKSQGLLEIYKESLVATRGCPVGTQMLLDSVLISQNSAAKESALACYRVPYLKTAFGDVPHSTPTQWTSTVSTPEYVNTNGVSHPRVITEFSSLLFPTTVSHDPNCVLTIEGDTATVTSVREIKRGEALSILMCNPYSMSSSHGHYRRKKTPDLRQCIVSDECDCDQGGVCVSGNCFFCDQELTISDELVTEENWIGTMVFNMLTHPSKYSLTQSVACFELLHSGVGTLHWASAAVALLILEYSCTGLHRDTKLGQSTIDRFRNLVTYIHRYGAFHDQHRPGTGLLSPGIVTMLSTKQTGRIILRALNTIDVPTCQLLADMICPGTVSAVWSCEDKNILKEITSAKRAAIEPAPAGWWKENPIGNCDVDPLRVKAAVSKLKQAIKSKTDPLSDPYSHSQQSMDGHIDQLLHSMGYDRGNDGEHDAGAYMSLLSKLSHDDDDERYRAPPRSNSPPQTPPLI